MKLIHIATDIEALIGDQVTSFRGEVCEIAGIQKPTSPASEGKVVVRYDDGMEGVYYVSVFGLLFTEREDRTEDNLHPKTYSIVRNFQSGKKRILETGVSLADAQKHCRHDDANSTTCNENTAYQLRTKGPWFDSYTEE